MKGLTLLLLALAACAAAASAAQPGERGRLRVAAARFAAAVPLRPPAPACLPFPEKACQHPHSPPPAAESPFETPYHRRRLLQGGASAQATAIAEAAARGDTNAAATAIANAIASGNADAVTAATAIAGERRGVGGSGAGTL